MERFYVVLSVFIIAVTGLADVTTVGQVTTAQEKLEFKTWLTKTASRVETTTPHGKITRIQRLDLKKAWTIQEGKGCFESFGGAENLKKINAVTEERMAKLPPQQRAAFEKYMKAMPGQAGGSDELQRFHYVKVKSNVRIRSWVADEYDVSLNGKPQSKTWLVPITQLHISEEDAKTIEDQAKESADRAAAVLRGRSPKTESDIPRHMGIVKSVSKTGTSTEMLSFDDKRLPASLFEPPSNCSKGLSVPK